MKARSAGLLVGLVVLVCTTGPGSPLGAQTGAVRGIARPLSLPWGGMSIAGVESTTEGRTRVILRYATSTNLTIIEAETITVTGTPARLDVLTAGPTTLSHRPTGVSSPDPQHFGPLRLIVHRDRPSEWQIPAR